MTDFLGVNEPGCLSQPVTLWCLQVCNNKKHCHCNPTYLPPDCANTRDDWPGGSVDSGNQQRAEPIPGKSPQQVEILISALWDQGIKVLASQALGGPKFGPQSSQKMVAQTWNPERGTDDKVLGNEEGAYHPPLEHMHMLKLENTHICAHTHRNTHTHAHIRTCTHALRRLLRTLHKSRYVR